MLTTYRVLRARDARLAAPQPADDARRDHHGRGLAVRARRRAAAVAARRPRHAAVEGRRRARDLHERQRDRRPDRGAQPRARRTTGTSARSSYLTKEDAYEEFKRLFQDQPDLVADHRPPRRCPRRSGSRPSRPSSPRRSPTAIETQPGVDEVKTAAKEVKKLLSATSWIRTRVHRHLLPAARRVAVPHREHDPTGDLRPPPRDRGHEARRRVELVRAHPVHARGAGAGRDRRRVRVRRGLRPEGGRDATRSAATPTSRAASTSRTATRTRSGST